MSGNSDEAIVYAWADFDQVHEGGIDLGSSADRYDEEYGWTAHDYAVAQGGTTKNYYTLGLNALLLSSGQDVPLVKRFKKVEIPYGRGDTVVLFSDGQSLIDVSKAGIFNTLTQEQLYGQPGKLEIILKFDGQVLYITGDYPRNTPVSTIDLRQGLASGEFTATEIDVSLGEKLKKANHDSGWWLRHLSPFSFTVNGKSFTVDNRRMKEWTHVTTTRILDDQGRVALEGRQFRKYIVDAIGFPVVVLCQHFPAIVNALDA